MQAEKIYVQHVLASQAELVWRLLNERRAYFYIAGYVAFKVFVHWGIFRTWIETSCEKMLSNGRAFESVC